MKHEYSQNKVLGDSSPVKTNLDKIIEDNDSASSPASGTDSKSDSSERKHHENPSIKVQKADSKPNVDELIEKLKSME